MQKPSHEIASSQSYTDFQQQQHKQIFNLIFPSLIQQQHEPPIKLYQNLQEFYNPKLHQEHLTNHAFRNPNPTYSQVYKQFIYDKFPSLKQPLISIYYQNSIFPDLKLLGDYRVNTSKYPNLHIPQLSQTMYVQLDKIFKEYGFIPHLQRFLTFYPQYLVKQRIVQRELFQNSKIDHQTTYFLGLCAAAENGCPYMINRMAIKYLSKGGKIEWIKNKKYPNKIASVLQLNRILARCIWDVKSQDFQQIVEQGHWNMNEIALIVQIFSYIHSLCVLTLGLGLQIEERNSILSTLTIQQDLKIYQQTNVESISKRKKTPLKQVLPVLIKSIEQMKSSVQLSQLKVNPKKSFRKQRKSSDDEEVVPVDLYMREIGNQLTEQKLVSKIMNELSFLLPKFTPIQKRRDTKYNQFTCDDFNFEIKSFPRLLSMTTVNESTKKIIAWIKQAEQMGLQNFGNQIIASTKQLRKAQRYYAQNLCGFSHPEYDYKKYMNKILTIPLKFYIRILMLSPLHMKRLIIDEINHQKGQIQLFDLGHTAILIALTKFKLSLTLSTYYFDN